MTAEVVNLRRARKAKARSERASQAAENRSLFGRTTGERANQAAAESKAARALDGHRLPSAPARDDG